MIKFRNLFLFTKKEVSFAFKGAQAAGYFKGIKLLKTPITSLEDQNLNHGKLLIITPRASGKSHERNLFRRRVKSIYYENKLYENQFVWIMLAYRKAVSIDFESLKKFMLEKMSLDS